MYPHAILLSTLLVCANAAFAAQGISWREQDAIGWACGGIGYEERQSLRVLESRGNVALLFVSGTRGGLIADVKLRVVSAKDPGLGLDITVEGPQCIVRLPAGDWQVQARHGQTLREQTLSVRASQAGAVQRWQFTFPAEAGDGPRATPEEASQVGDWGKVGR